MGGSNDSGNTLAIAALTVALVALIVALGQILGQYFATADGYRRCQASVMGPWARKTRLRWRWSQFRFETFFTTPEIVLSDYPVAPIVRNGDVGSTLISHWGLSSEADFPSFHTLSSVSQHNEMVCWIPFLHSLYWNEKELSDFGCYDFDRATSWLVRPAVRFRERSWDFMSPEVVRPFAVTNVSHIGAMTRRLGMIWTDFRPEEGIMRAEGNGHILSSTFVRSIGVILHYMNLGESHHNHRSGPRLSKADLYIPSRTADMLGFGILPGFRGLHMPHFKIGTISEVYASMNILDKSHKASQKIKDIRGIESTCTFGFSDLIPLAAPMMRIRGTSIVRLPIPTEYCVGLTCHKEGFVVFHNRLKEFIASKDGGASVHIKWVLDQYDFLKAHYSEWENEAEANDQINDRNLAFLDSVHTNWDHTTNYFIELEKLEKGLRYFDLVASHVTHGVNYWGDAWSNLREGKARDHYGLRDWIAEGAHMYFDYLPSIAADMARKGAPEHLGEEAWIVMMFRAFCWWRCHYMNPGESMIQDPLRIPSRYWDSKLPIYIG